MRIPLPAMAAGLVLLAFATPVAADPSVERRLTDRGIKFGQDDDGDFRVIYDYRSEKRTQLLIVSGATESVGGFSVWEVYAPAGRIGDDPIDGAKALELLADSRAGKLGSWELAGTTLVCVIQLPDEASAAALEAAIDIAATAADNMEMRLSGRKDAF